MTDVDVERRHDPDATVELANRIVALTHSLGRFKQHVQQVTRADPQWAYDAILHHVATCAPVRAGALAELTQVDPSTVSRQVAALVRDGLVERRADPGDGRASLLQPTALGRARYARHCERRGAHYRVMLADWTAAERAQFATYLARFTEAFDNYESTILADVISDSAARSAGKDQS